jgi:hypothetical protein
MQKNLIFCLFLLLTGFKATSQNTDSDSTVQSAKLKITFSSEYENEKKDASVYYMFRDEKGNIYTIKRAGFGVFATRKNYIEKYSPNLKQVFEKELVITQTEGNELNLVNAFTFGGKACIFASYFNKVKEKRYLFVMKIEENGALTKPLKIAEFDSEKDRGYFEIKLSRDSSKLMVVALLPVDKKALVLPIVFSVLDNDFKELWKGKSSFPTEKEWGFLSGTSYKTIFDNVTVDNKGRIFALIQVPRDKTKKEKNDSESFYKMYIFENGAKESKKFTIDLNKKTIYACTLVPSSNPDEMIAVGTYSENKQTGWFTDNKGTNGSFYFKINAQTGTISNKTVNPFSSKMFEFMKLDEKDQQKGKGIDNLVLLFTSISANNNVLLSLSQDYEEEYVDAKGRYVRTIYNSKTMFNIKYDASGKIMYQNYIPKSLESSSSTFGMHHILAPIGERYAMIFNDHQKNSEKKLETYRSMSTARPGSDRTVARLVSVDEKGRRKISTLFGKKDEDFVLQPYIELQYAPGVIITMAELGQTFMSIGKSKKFKLIKIEY